MKLRTRLWITNLSCVFTGDGAARKAEHGEDDENKSVQDDPEQDVTPRPAHDQIVDPCDNTGTLRRRFRRKRL